MAANWSYAQMSQEAAAVGGPDAWLSSIKEEAYNNGASDMKNKLILPLLLAGMGLGTIGTVGYQKIRKWIAEKKAERLITEQKVVDVEELVEKELDVTIEEANKNCGGF